MGPLLKLLLIGLFLRLPICNKLDRVEIMDDSNFWDMPDEGVPLCPGEVPNEHQANAGPQRAGANVVGLNLAAGDSTY